MLAGVVRHANGHSPPECSARSGFDAFAFCGPESLVKHAVELFRDIFRLPKLH